MMAVKIKEDMVIDYDTGEILGKVISEKQTTVIGYIEENLKIKFLGCTLLEASEFITKYMEESKQVSKDKYKNATTYHCSPENREVTVIPSYGILDNLKRTLDSNFFSKHGYNYIEDEDDVMSFYGGENNL